MGTGPLFKFSHVRSHLLESWCASFPTSLMSEDLVCVRTAESRFQVRREKRIKKNLPDVRGLRIKSGRTACSDSHDRVIFISGRSLSLPAIIVTIVRIPYSAVKAHAKIIWKTDNVDGDKC